MNKPRGNDSADPDPDPDPGLDSHSAPDSDSDSDSAHSVWLRPPVPPAVPPLTLERITEGAVALLDEEGMDRLTMRHLAERLGVGTTTLYWHIKTKADVIDLAIDAIFGETPLPDGDSGDWRENIVTLLSDCRATLLRHPWSAALPLRQRPSIGPNFLAWMEFLQACLVRVGFRGQAATAACWLLYSHLQGSTASQSSLRWSDSERTAAQQQLHHHRDTYPTLAAHDYLLDDDWEQNFHLGLRYALDGLQAQIDLRRRPVT
ncbi:TetR/AcrR family transcriptional regulator (plasmid) [Streptomyces sp. CWNU-52B]|uniref:TetR/AcrR family transcriptional regulator n=1 Tax=unclassified Streptomyces TaxID=2593676 RepID=UPI0039C13728